MLQISCGVEILIALHCMGFIPVEVEKLLNLILDTAGLCWTRLPTPALQWSADDNSDVMDIVVISVSCLPIELELLLGFFS